MMSTLAPNRSGCKQLICLANAVAAFMFANGRNILLPFEFIIERSSVGVLGITRSRSRSSSSIVLLNRLFVSSLHSSAAAATAAVIVNVAAAPLHKTLSPDSGSFFSAEDEASALPILHHGWTDRLEEPSARSY